MERERLKLLIVHFSGEPLVANTIDLLFHEAGMDVEQREARSLKRTTSQYHVIVQVGVGEPPEPGLACLAELRLWNLTTPLVVVSEHGAEYMAERVNLVANAHFLHRPYGGEQVLIDTVRNAAANKTAP